MVISGNTEISLLLFYIFQDNHLICAAFGFLFFSVENFLFDNQQKAVKEAEGGGGQRKKKKINLHTNKTTISQGENDLWDLTGVLDACMFSWPIQYIQSYTNNSEEWLLTCYFQLRLVV